MKNQKRMKGTKIEKLINSVIAQHNKFKASRETKMIRIKLTKKEQKHLTDTGLESITLFKRNRVKQIKLRNEFLDIEPCSVCNMIAKKLGLE